MIKTDRMFHRRVGSYLYVYFDGTEPSIKGWLINFFFKKLPYKRMEQKWRVHAGFLLIWLHIKDQFAALIDDSVEKILIEGVSQGGAVAVLAHEYVWFNHPRLRDGLSTITYGAPRCLDTAGALRIADRFDTLLRKEHIGDIVCHLPPFALGFKHVGRVVRFGEFSLNIVKNHSSYKIIGI